jgi:ribosomal protein L21
MISTPSRDAQAQVQDDAAAAAIGGQVDVHAWETETIPPHIATCELTVLEHTKSPLERIVKSKRRKGYKKTIEHKQGWTRLRVGDIHLGDGHAVIRQEGEAGLA